MKQHAAWRHPEVDMPGGIFRGGPGRPVRLPGPAPACLRRRAAAPDPGPPASLTADRPRAGGAEDAGGGPVKPGHVPANLVVTLDTVKGMWATSWASSARPTAPRAVARARELSLIPGRGPSQPRPGHCIPTTARHQRRARLHLGARCSPEDSTRHVPFRGTPGPPDLPSVRRTERTPKGGSAMATVKPDPSNGSTALTRTAAALAS